MKKKSHKLYKDVFNYIEALAVCHTIVVERKKDKQGNEKIFYNASSPDELALVNAARHWGFKFLDRNEDNDMIFDAFGKEKKYRLLNVIEFNSDRKRMSVIVKTPNNRIICICKGADSIIEPRLKQNEEAGKLFDKTLEHLESFAKEGLRTLLVASKELDIDWYQNWATRYEAARASTNRLVEMDKVEQELEVELDLLGSTAIEDKL